MSFVLRKEKSHRQTDGLTGTRVRLTRPSRAGAMRFTNSAHRSEEAGQTIEDRSVDRPRPLQAPGAPSPMLNTDEIHRLARRASDHQPWNRVGSTICSFRPLCPRLAPRFLEEKNRRNGMNLGDLT
jgi:hypothetical protein